MMPLYSNLTREPRPSMTLQPSANKSDSSLVHSNVEAVGFENIACNVLVCFELISNVLSNTDSSFKRH